jgi:hypothetical protein
MYIFCLPLWGYIRRAMGGPPGLKPLSRSTIRTNAAACQARVMACVLHPRACVRACARARASRVPAWTWHGVCTRAPGSEPCGAIRPRARASRVSQAACQRPCPLGHCGRIATPVATSPHSTQAHAPHRLSPAAHPGTVARSPHFAPLVKLPSSGPIRCNPLCHNDLRRSGRRWHGSCSAVQPSGRPARPGAAAEPLRDGRRTTTCRASPGQPGSCEPHRETC